MSETSIVTPSGTPNLNKALSALQGVLPKITKANEGKVEGQSKDSGKSYSYKYKYADLADVTGALGPLLAKYGLAFHCAPTINPADRREMILVWSLLHESGEERNGEWPLGPVNQKPQSLGSAVTYGRRYCLGAATGIVAEDDDDGQSAQREHGNHQSAGDVFEKAAPVRPMNQGPREATRPAVAESDPDFLDRIGHEIDGINSREDGAKVFGMLVAAFNDGTCTPDDRRALEPLIKAKVSAVMNQREAA